LVVTTVLYVVFNHADLFIFFSDVLLLSVHRDKGGILLMVVLGRDSNVK
jgi:hypothetical protein